MKSSVIKNLIDSRQLKKDLTNKRAIIPNLLSLSRIAAPFVIPPLVLSGNIPLVLLTSSAFLLTDFLDGKIARALKGTTKTGQLIDQVSDKICAIGLLIGLIPSIPLMTIPLILESTIAVINIKGAISNNNCEGKSTQSGRIKMWPLGLSTITGYAMLLNPSTILSAITYLGLTATTALEIVNIKEYHELAKQKSSNSEEHLKTIENNQSIENQVKTNEKGNQQINSLTEENEKIRAINDLKELLMETKREIEQEDTFAFQKINKKRR